MQREVTKLNNEIYRGESSIGRVWWQYQDMINNI
jgi:hypothetical protein